jgi:hypothetical protein
MQFNGTFQDLQAVVCLLHLEGHWVDEGDLQCFRCSSGECINVWPARAELQVSGHPEASRALERRLQQALAPSQS